MKAKTIGKTPMKKTSKAPREEIDKASGKAIGEDVNGEMTMTTMMGMKPTKKTGKAPREVINKASGEAVGEEVISKTTKNRESMMSLGKMMTMSQVREIVHRMILPVILVLPNMLALAELNQSRLSAITQR